MKTIEEFRDKIVDRLLFDIKLVSPMISEELEYNARQLAKEILSLKLNGITLQDLIEFYLERGDEDVVRVKREGIISPCEVCERCSEVMLRGELHYSCDCPEDCKQYNKWKLKANYKQVTKTLKEGNDGRS
jgi:hypothetical protein